MVLQNAINNLITPQAANRVYGIARRQCISASNGILSSNISGLNITITGTAIAPIVCTFAAGWDVLGIPIDYVGTFTSNQTFSNLTANTTHYFYLERNTTTGILTCNKITIVPIYSATAPASPVTGQHWFKIFADSNSGQPGYTMYEWSGSAWVVQQRVFIVEVTTGASAITSFANYATNRQYQSAWVAYNGTTTIILNHNLGMTVAEAQAVWSAYGRSSSADLTATFAQMIWARADGTNFHGIQPRAGNRLSHTFTVQPSGLYIDNANLQVVIGQVQIAISSGW